MIINKYMSRKRVCAEPGCKRALMSPSWIICENKICNKKRLARLAMISKAKRELVRKHL